MTRAPTGPWRAHHEQALKDALAHHNGDAAAAFAAATARCACTGCGQSAGRLCLDRGGAVLAAPHSPRLRAYVTLARSAGLLGLSLLLILLTACAPLASRRPALAALGSASGAALVTGLTLHGLSGRSGGACAVSESPFATAPTTVAFSCRYPDLMPAAASAYALAAAALAGVVVTWTMPTKAAPRAAGKR